MPLSPPKALCRDGRLGKRDFCMPSRRIERLLRDEPLRILASQDAAGGTSGAQILTLAYPSVGLVLRAKWKAAVPGGEMLNNVPRKELAAYEAQKLLLDPEAYVVPPTVGRCIPGPQHRRDIGLEPATFDGAGCVYGTLTYWVEHLKGSGVRDLERFERDPAYRAAVGNLNLVTYFIDHRDTRAANFLIARDADDPRVLVVDNGLAFSGLRNPLAWFRPDWSNVIVPALPRRGVERLRALARADLDRLLVVEQWRVEDGLLVREPPGEPFDADQGVRRRGDVIQLGLTRAEVDAMWARRQALLERIDAGSIALFDDDDDHQPRRRGRARRAQR